MFKTVSIADVFPNPDQPRKNFGEDELRDLGTSIKSVGVINPLLVTEEKAGKYLIVDGERRWRAAQAIGLNEIPVFIRNHKNILETSLMANIQREDLNAIEQAWAFRQLLKDGGTDVYKLSKRVGRNTAYIENRICWLDMSGEIQALVARELIPIERKVCSALKSVSDIDEQIRIAYKNKGGRAVDILKECDSWVRKNALADYPHMIRHATERAKVSNRFMLELVKEKYKRLPPWKTVVTASMRACGRCALNEIASSTVCVECPGVELLSQVLQIAESDVDGKGDEA